MTVADGRLSWDWDLPPLAVEAHPRSPISFHVPAQVAGTPFHHEARAIVKFNSFWTIELEPGYALFATHPVNRDDLPFRLLTGMVDSDRFTDVGILFPAVWTDPGFEGVLPRGTPVAQCFPVARATLDLDCRAFTEDDARRYADTAATLVGSQGTYRKSFRVKRPPLNRRGFGVPRDPCAKPRDRAIARPWVRSSWPGRYARTCRAEASGPRRRPPWRPRGRGSPGAGSRG